MNHKVINKKIKNFEQLKIKKNVNIYFLII